MPWRKRVVFGGACLAGLLAAGYAGYVGWQQSVVDQMLFDLKAAGSPVPGVGICRMRSDCCCSWERTCCWESVARR